MELFGKLPDGKPAHLYTLKNKNGLIVKITNYGGIITSIEAPDRSGNLGQVVLGFPNLSSYLNPHPFLGAIVGRYANRIGKGQFQIGQIQYQLEQNLKGHHIHGGSVGFDKQLWAAKLEGQRLTLSILSPDGDCSFPGNLAVKVIYELSHDNELIIRYEATTDKATIINLTNHSYFNLKDGGKSPIGDHLLQLNAHSFTETDNDMIPTGRIIPVKDTPMDFTTSIKIGQRINESYDALIKGNGYDHNYIIEGAEHSLSLAATVIEPESGRQMKVLTTKPGIQFYTANWLDGSLMGHENIAYLPRHAFCLETQYFPDSPNHPHFPDPRLYPGETYSHQTIYQFDTID